jgi:hypothetical protein
MWIATSGLSVSSQVSKEHMHEVERTDVGVVELAKYS